LIEFTPKEVAMNSTQENAIRFNLESARDRSQQEAEQLRLMLRELVSLWEHGSIVARVKKAAAVKSKFETARKLIDELP
jgi:ribosomal protein L17